MVAALHGATRKSRNYFLSIKEGGGKAEIEADNNICPVLKRINCFGKSTINRKRKGELIYGKIGKRTN